MDLSAFKAYDIRGAYPEQINEDLAYCVGRAVGRYLCAKTIVVGRDMRKSSPSLLAMLVKGITSEGVNVVDIGVCTTPMLNFAVARYRYSGGIMVSASHNPAGDNAFKIINSSVIQIGDTNGIFDIKNLITEGLGEASFEVGAVEQKNIISDYLEHIQRLLGSIKPLKVVFDYGNGVGAVPCSPIIDRLGIDAIELYKEPDGSFPNHPANPHDLANFSDLSAKVLETGADLGVFFDGDGDRANFVDETGRVVPIDILTVLLAKELLKDTLGKIYYDLRFSKSVPSLIKQLGGIPIMMKVGNPYYKIALSKDGGLMGAEFSGHIMFSENYNIDDGLFAALKVIQLVGSGGVKLSKLIDNLTKGYASPEESVVAKTPLTVFNRLSLAFPKSKQLDIDGLYLDFENDGFISVRQSQNEPGLFRVRVEANTEEALRERFNLTKNIIVEG